MSYAKDVLRQGMPGPAVEVTAPHRRLVSAMKPFCSSDPCFTCTDRVLCRCLRVRESTVVDAIVTLGLRTVKEIREHTGAGDGCTCCHGELRRCLEDYAPVLTGEAV